MPRRIPSQRGRRQADGAAPQPPRLARAILRAVLPDDLRGRTIEGDLLQELEERAAASSRASLWAWYWTQAIDLGGRYAIQRLRGHPRTAPGPTRSGNNPGPDAGHLNRTGGVMESLWTDLRYAIRMLVRTPTLSGVSIMTIGLGIGLVTFTFSIVYGAILRPLPVRDPDRFVSLMATWPEEGVDRMSMPMADFVAFRDQATSYETLAAGYDGTVNVARVEGPPERFEGAFMTANGLEMLGVPPHLGRTFRNGEDEAGVEGTVVLGYDVWRNSFNADEGVIGTSIRVNGESMTIIGVMPPGFRFPFDQEIWVAYRGAWEGQPRRSGDFFETWGYLKEGVSLESAVQEAEIIAARLASEFSDTNEGIGARVTSFQEAYMPMEIVAVMWLMLGATVGVMLIACANVANLLLARAALRSRDVAIRTAVGASRLRMIRQLLAEALVLGALGGVLGLVLAYFSTNAFVVAVEYIQKPYWIDMRTDLPTLLFSAGITLLAAMAAGTIPALRASGSGVGSVLNDEGRGSSSLRLGRLTGTLVTVEIALSCALLIAAGLMVRSVINFQQMDIGFDSENLLTARVGIFDTEYPSRDDRQNFFRELHHRLNEAPGVEAAAFTSALPATGPGRWDIAIEGHAYGTDADYPPASFSWVSAGYFAAMRTPVLAGREFRESEVYWSSEIADDMEPVTIVNQSFVARFLPDANPLGKRIRVMSGAEPGPWMRIVGVVPDLYAGAWGPGGIGADEVPAEQFYMTIGQSDVRFLSIVMRGRGSIEGLPTQAQAAVAALDPDVPIYWVMPMSQVFTDNQWAFSMFGSLFSIFGATALFLAAIGLYGVVSFSVAQRRHEMGVRMALGAEAGDILRIVFGRVGVQLAAGLALGLLLGWSLSGPLRFVMFGVETSDLTVYSTVVATLAITALLAAFFPAQRATRVDPVTALRPD